LISLAFSGETLIGTASVLTALVGAVFTGLVSLRHVRRDVATANVMELRAHREAWVWAVRIIYSLLTLLGRNGIPEPEGIRKELDQYQNRIDNPEPSPSKEAAS
jgi:hypothetical protein